MRRFEDHRNSGVVAVAADIVVAVDPQHRRRPLQKISAKREDGGAGGRVRRRAQSLEEGLRRKGEEKVKRRENTNKTEEK